MNKWDRDEQRKDARWLGLLNAAEDISRIGRTLTSPMRTSALSEVEDRLSDILELFPKDVDPVADLEGYSLRRFCRAVITVIEPLKRVGLSAEGESRTKDNQRSRWKLMKSVKLPKTIYITTTDRERLERVIAQSEYSPNIEMLEEELTRATVVPSQDVPADVVTMNSRVRFKDLESGEESEFVLSYPWDAALEQGKLSVLAPVGTALLGLRVGDEIEWPLPSGKTRSLSITSVLFQPEAAGQFHL